MRTQVIIAATLSLCLLVTVQTYAKLKADSYVDQNSSGATIAITRLDVNNTNLQLSWVIKNDSGQDAWILAGLGNSDTTTSVFMDEDDQTLLLRRRLDIPARPDRASFPTCDGRYVRLRPAETQAESVSL
ncbi:MAG: hypothetical protein P8Z79_01280, partial [Sedimentisphaerales bacterium]